MTLSAFTVHAEPGDVTVTVNGHTIPAARVIIDADGGVPVLTVIAAGPVALDGTGVVETVRDPTPAELNEAAIGALAAIDAGELERRTSAKIRAGRNDVYRVVLETLKEMADG